MHQVLSRPVKIHSPGMALLESPDAVHRTDSLPCARVKNGVRFSRGPDVHLLVGAAKGGKPGGFAFCGSGEASLYLQLLETLREVFCPEASVVKGERRFSGGAGKMAFNHIGIVGIEDGRFKGPFEQLGGCFMKY